MSVHTIPPTRNEDPAERLLQLSDEVSRIAATLSRMSSKSVRPAEPKLDLDGTATALSPNAIKAVAKARRLRARYFDGELFADPAWDILLELLLAEVCEYRVAVSSLCIAAQVPATTALRYISSMTDSGLLRRRPDPMDGRRMFVELTPRASDALRRYFACLKTVSVV